MILTGHEIERCVARGDIVLDPFDPAQINPNSYDLRLGPTLLTYRDEVLDPRRENATDQHDIPPQGTVLRAGGFYLGASVERIGSRRMAPIIHAKSGIARLGLFVHVTADLVDIGSIGNVTFQLHPTIDVTVYPGMLLGQVSFWAAKGEVRLYEGKYQGSVGPQASKSHLPAARSTSGRCHER